MKLNYKRTMLVGLAFLSICTFWQMYDFTVPLILKNTYGLNDTWSGVVMAMDNVLALFLLPFFGALSDRCKAGIGRRMPFILLGTGLAVVWIVLMPTVIGFNSLTAFLILLGLLLVSMGLYRSRSRPDAGRDAQAAALQGQRHHQPDGHRGRYADAGAQQFRDPSLCERERGDCF